MLITREGVAGKRFGVCGTFNIMALIAPGVSEIARLTAHKGNNAVVRREFFNVRARSLLWIFQSLLHLKRGLAC